MKKFKTFFYLPNASFSFRRDDVEDRVLGWLNSERRSVGDAILVSFTDNPSYPVTIHIGADRG